MGQQIINKSAQDHRLITTTIVRYASRACCCALLQLHCPALLSAKSADHARHKPNSNANSASECN
jgi:hypothetical protein